MIIVSPNTTNALIYYSRYNRIDKYEIINHSTNVITSGTTYLIGNGSKILHSGITYNFQDNGLYTYKAYYFDTGYTNEYYISNQTLLRCFTDRFVDTFIEQTKPRNTFITKTTDTGSYVLINATDYLLINATEKIII